MFESIKVQSKHNQKKLEEFNLSHAKSMTTPLKPKSNLKNVNEIIIEEELEMKKVPCKSTVGVEIYLGITTRTDLATSTSMVAQYNFKPRHHQWLLLEKIFRYLRGTTTNRLIYNGNNGNLEVIGYYDQEMLKEANQEYDMYQFWPM